MRKMSRLASAVAVLCLTCFLAAHNPAVAQQQYEIQVFKLNDHLIVFYTGRLAPPSVPADQRTWAESGALDLGIATFAIHSGREALVYDTFTSTDLAKWVRSYLERMGIARFTVVNSHWHLDRNRQQRGPRRGNHEPPAHGWG